MMSGKNRCFERFYIVFVVKEIIFISLERLLIWIFVVKLVLIKVGIDINMYI